MRKLLLVLLFTGLAMAGYAQQPQESLKKIYVDKFFTCTLDQMMDTLAKDHHLKIVFERDSISKYHVVDHFFNEPLKNVLNQVCGRNKLNYWVEADGTIYILQKTDDLDRLKKLNALVTTGKIAVLQHVEPPKAPPTSFKFSINGKVFDQATGESLPSATVRVLNSNLSASTGADGLFVIFDVPSDTCVIETSYSGYQTNRIRLDASKIKGAINVEMFQALNTLNEITILGKKSGVMNTDAKKVGVLQLTPSSLDKLPNMGEKDVLKAFQLMPGVSAANDSSSGAYVRGGTPDQNLIVFDGFTVYQVDHLYGFFSAFNSNAVKDVQLYKGGFSSKYGGRLSSVTEITGKDGNSKSASWGFDLSLLSVNLYGETPLSDKSSLLVAFRRSYQGPLYDKIFKQFNATTVPAGGGGGGGMGGPPGGGGGRGGFGQQVTPSSFFYDADVRYTYRLNANNTFAWSFYTGTDKTDNSRDLPSFGSNTVSNSITDYTKYGNLSSAIKWSSVWNTSLHSNTYLTYSSYFNDRNRTNSGVNQVNGVDVAFNNGTVEKNDLKDIALKSEWDWQLNNTFKLLYGGFASHQNINYTYTQNDTSKLINQHNKALTGGAYAELEIDPTSKLHLQPGMRTTWYQGTGKQYFEPRFSASYSLNRNYTLKVATGQFSQFINQVTRQDVLNGNRNFWVLSDGSNIPVGSARHYMGGASYENDQFLINVEAYYKTLSGLTQYTLRQQGFGPGGGSATLQQAFYTGAGNAKGIELMVQKKMGLYTGWVSYTLANTQNKFDVYGNAYYPADQDVTHEFKSINMYHYNRWNFSAVFIFSTGRPYTAPLSSYTINSVDGNTTTAFNVGAKNAERLPNYHRLDVSATYDLIRIDGNKVGSIGLSLFNLYNHRNTWYREYQVQNNQVITTDVTYLGFTPNITLSLKWK